jgi:hypothetical protein
LRVLLKEILRKIVARESGHGFDAHMEKGNGVEDALNNKAFLQTLQREAGGRPHVALVEGVVFFAFAAKVGFLPIPPFADDALPKAGFCRVQIKAHGGHILPVAERIAALLVPATDLGQVEATVQPKVGICRGVTVLRRGRVLLGEIVKQLRQGLAHGLAESAFVFAVAVDHQGAVFFDVERFFAALGAKALGEVFAGIFELKIGRGQQGRHNLGVVVLPRHGGPLFCRGRAGRRQGRWRPPPDPALL